MDHQFASIARSLGSRRSIMAALLGLAALLGQIEIGAGKKGRKGKGKGKGGKGGKGKKRCRGGLKKVAGRCAKVCDLEGHAVPEVCDLGACYATYVDGVSQGQPRVCIVPPTDQFDCDSHVATICNNHGECEKDEICSFSGACMIARCWPIDKA